MDYEKLTNREIDALVAEKVMDISLIPPREKAMVEIGWMHISSTGAVFSLRNGEDLPMPAGATLPQPKGTTDWNARYALYVAKHLGDLIAAEVDAVREEPDSYSTNDNFVRLVVNRIEELGLEQQFEEILCDVIGYYGRHPAFPVLKSTARQKCIAALKAVEGASK